MHQKQPPPRVITERAAMAAEEEEEPVEVEVTSPDADSAAEEVDEEEVAMLLPADVRVPGTECELPSVTAMLASKTSSGTSSSRSSLGEWGKERESGVVTSAPSV